MKRGRELSSADAVEPDAKHANESPVTVEEEAQLRLYIERKIPSMVKHLKFPLRVKATALLYFKRFYALHSCLEHDPARIAPACIYLACKVEEAYVGADRMAGELQLRDANVLLRSELPLLQALEFDLLVHSPYRALRGLLAELRELRRQQDSAGSLDAGLAAASEDDVRQLAARAERHMDAIMHSDVPLLFTPGQIAAAALRSSCRAAKLDCAAFLAHLAAKGAADSAAAVGQPAGVSAAEAAQQLLDALQRIDQQVVAGMSVDDQQLEAAAQDVDRRIKLWKRSAVAGGAAAAVADGELISTPGRGVTGAASGSAGTAPGSQR